MEREIEKSKLTEKTSTLLLHLYKVVLSCALRTYIKIEWSEQLNTILNNLKGFEDLKETINNTLPKWYGNEKSNPLQFSTDMFNLAKLVKSKLDPENKLDDVFGIYNTLISIDSPVADKINVPLNNYSQEIKDVVTRNNIKGLEKWANNLNTIFEASLNQQKDNKNNPYFNVLFWTNGWIESKAELNKYIIKQVLKEKTTNKKIDYSSNKHKR